MPPIQRRVLREGEGVRGLVGSKAERLGGIVWTVPVVVKGWAEGEVEEVSMVKEGTA